MNEPRTKKQENELRAELAEVVRRIRHDGVGDDLKLPPAGSYATVNLGTPLPFVVDVLGKVDVEPRPAIRNEEQGVTAVPGVRRMVLLFCEAHELPPAERWGSSPLSKVLTQADIAALADEVSRRMMANAAPESEVERLTRLRELVNAPPVPAAPIDGLVTDPRRAVMDPDAPIVPGGVTAEQLSPEEAAEARKRMATNLAERSLIEDLGLTRRPDGTYERVASAPRQVDPELKVGSYKQDPGELFNPPPKGE